MILFMNGSFGDFTNKHLSKAEADILLSLHHAAYTTQRALAQQAGISLGKVNDTLRTLEERHLLDAQKQPTPQALHLLSAGHPQSAVILAAGSGLRMAPLSELPKGLLRVRDERLIDRLISQLHEVGVTNITVITGFMKEAYEYLGDVEGVRLRYNPEYAKKNNLHSLVMALDCLENAYILPSDLWFAHNPFSNEELYSWYLLSTRRSAESEAAVNRRQEMIPCDDAALGYAMVGLAYICKDASDSLRSLLESRAQKRRHLFDFWENALLYPPCETVYAKFIAKEDVCEINTFEDLRNLDYSVDQLSSGALNVICDVLHTPIAGIRDVSIMKKGMTNRSFRFSVDNRPYIMRIPGEGSQIMINREQEYAVYQAISGHDIGDRIAYISPHTGYKLTEFWPDARVCNPRAPEDVCACMGLLRRFHELGLKVKHTFDLFERIDFYERLRAGEPSVYLDYARTKEQVLALKGYIASQPREFALTHIDAVHDNFLFVAGGIHLIDWEYAAMQDPHVDIAMFAIYAGYDRPQVNALVDSYFPEGASAALRLKIDCYIAVCGLLWSNWCEYKRTLGVEFREYALCQYRYAKEYSAAALAQIAMQGKQK